MARHLSGIDHFVVAVRDLDAARDDYARMGFSLTPRGYHSVGSENHLATFGNGYLELLTVRRPHPVTAYFSSFLEHGDGAAAMVVATGDAQALYRDWCAAGLPAEPPVSLSRPVLGTRGNALARFKIVQLDLSYTPGGLVYACEHLTPELTHQPQHAGHPNGVTSLAAVTIDIAAGQLSRAAERYERVLASSACAIDETVRLVPCADVDVLLQERDRATSQEVAPRALPYLSSLTFNVESLELIAETLRRNGVACERGGGMLSIPGALAHGVTLRFIARR